MTGDQWAWSRFRILRLVFFALLIVGFSPLLPASLAQYNLAIEILWGMTLLLLGRYLGDGNVPGAESCLAARRGTSCCSLSSALTAG